MKICLHRESNLRLLAFQPGALDHLAMLTVIELWFKLLHYFKLWINSTRVTMHVWNWLWLDVNWNLLSDILFISYVNQCWFYLLLITVFRLSKPNPNHALFKHWIAFCRCSRAIWIASEKIAKTKIDFLSEAIHIAREQRKNTIQYSYLHHLFTSKVVAFCLLKHKNVISIRFQTYKK